MKISAMLKASSFAHLLGLPAARAEEEDDEKKQRDDESDEDYAKRMDEDDKEKKDAKAEEGDEKDSADDEDAEDEGGDDKKSRKAKKAEEGDDDESMAAARKSERARCAAIFATSAAGARPDLAAHLAFNTDMSSKDAIALLGAAATGGRPRGLADRMSGVKVANVGSDAGEPVDAKSPKAVAAQIIAAAAKARGEK